jgi:octaprenyl-diphosphate synthase
MMMVVRFMIQIVLDNNAKIANIVQNYSYFCAVKKLEHIICPVTAELQQFEVFFGQALRAETAPMDGIMRYVSETKGKRLRPILVLLSAKMFGEPNEKTLRAATFAEMVHSATLIHDDVVDNTNLRRGQASVKAHFGNLSAVLAGDYLFSKAMLLLSHPDDHAMLQEMLQTAAAMSEGELMQNASIRSLSLTKGRPNDIYFDIITRKTALLMRSCCAVGALSVKAAPEQVQQISDFGLNFGQLFQMRDDILDADNAEILALAQELLPVQLQKTLDSLQFFPDSEIRDAFEQLTWFCAEREL